MNLAVQRQTHHRARRGVHARDRIAPAVLHQALPVGARASSVHAHHAQVVEQAQTVAIKVARYVGELFEGELTIYFAQRLILDRLHRSSRIMVLAPVLVECDAGQARANAAQAPGLQRHALVVVLAFAVEQRHRVVGTARLFALLAPHHEHLDSLRSTGARQLGDIQIDAEQFARLVVGERYLQKAVRLKFAQLGVVGVEHGCLVLEHIGYGVIKEQAAHVGQILEAQHDQIAEVGVGAPSKAAVAQRLKRIGRQSRIERDSAKVSSNARVRLQDVLAASAFIYRLSVDGERLQRYYE